MLAQGADSLLYDELVRKRALTGGVDAGINWGLGNMFDYSGPMLWIAQFFHDADDAVRQAARRRSTPSSNACARTGSIRRRSIARASRCARRSTPSLEQFAGFGRANLLASFALFDDDPARINRLEDGVRQGDAGAAAEDGAASTCARATARSTSITPGKTGAGRRAAEVSAR